MRSLDPTTAEIMRSNPHMTYAQAVGYGTGLTAARLGEQFAGLSRDDWLKAGDDYACGYRQGFKPCTTSPSNSGAKARA
jgi:hypothetical protein